MRTFVVALLLTVLPPTAKALDVSTSGLLVEEVLSKSSSPREYDWRQAWFTVEAEATQINEANSFESSGYGLGLSRDLGDILSGSLGSAWLARLNFRRVETRATESTRLIALTPFTQAAQPSRYEILAGVGFTLLEGRSATPLGPRMTDIEHALLLLGGLQYNIHDSTDSVDTLPPGMRAVKYRFVGETGLRFQIFLPRALGLALEWTYSFPLTDADPDLRGWQRYGGALSWSFGL